MNRSLQNKIKNEVLDNMANSLFFLGANGHRIITDYLLFERSIEEINMCEEFKNIIHDKENIKTIKNLLNTNCKAFIRLGSGCTEQTIDSIKSAITEYILSTFGRKETIIHDDISEDWIQETYLFKGRYSGSLLNKNSTLSAIPVTDLPFNVRLRNVLKYKSDHYCPVVLSSSSCKSF